MNRAILSAALFLLLSTTASQALPIVDSIAVTDSERGPRVRPRSLGAASRYNLFGPSNVVTAPPLDLPALLAEDAVRTESGSPPRVGVILDIDAVDGRDGLWTSLEDGGWLWTMAFHAPDAASIRLRFRDWAPPPGAELVVYDAYQPEHAYGPMTGGYASTDGVLFSYVVFSDRANLEYYLPAGMEPGTPRSWITVDGILHQYRDLSGQVVGARDAGRLVDCFLDVNCYSVWDFESSGIGRIFSVRVGDSVLCSGTVLNRTAGDMAPLFLTAAHCGTVDFPQSDVVLWYWETDSCNGAPVDPGTLPQSMGSVNLVNALGGPDTALLGLRNDLPIGMALLGWDANYLPNGSACTSIHHPGGDYKRITFLQKDSDGEGCSGANYACSWGTNSGDITLGSSGGPLFDESARIRGVVSCGNGGCGPGSHWFGRFDVAWPMLQPWLAPTDPIHVDGGFGGTELGTISNPFDSVGEAMFAVIAGSTIHVDAGSYDEQFTIDRPMVIDAPGGTVVLGQ